MYSGQSAKPKSNFQKAKDKIFFEKQQGALCGQHCLNNALQSHMFNPVDLSDIAKQLDEKEAKAMAERGTDTREYQEFVSKPSSNFDDSGYFSVQVLSQALKNMNLELVSLNSDDERSILARRLPEEQRLFICHMEDHWFAMRKFGQQWVNLNSFLKTPELVTDTYFAILLKTLQGEGYVIFVVFGELPECEADRLWSALRRGEDGKYAEETETVGYRLGTAETCTDEQNLEQGIRLSLAKTPVETIRAQRAAFLDRLQKKPDEPSTSFTTVP